MKKLFLQLIEYLISSHVSKVTFHLRYDVARKIIVTADKIKIGKLKC